MSARDDWGEGGAYEPYIGRWSRVVARRFLAWLAPAPGARWLDIGCGTGALTETILEAAQPSSVCGVDPSEAYIGFARRRIVDPRAEFAVADAYDLPGDNDSYDYTVSGLALNFVPDALRAVEEMKRVSSLGGCIAAYVWDYAEGMEMIRYFWDAATELDPQAANLDEASRFPVCRPEPLRALWERAALREVTVTSLDIETAFRDLDDYWEPFLGGQGPAPGYLASLEESARDRLRTLIRGRLPIVDAGTISLRARAWAIQGQP